MNISAMIFYGNHWVSDIVEVSKLFQNYEHFEQNVRYILQFVYIHYILLVISKKVSKFRNASDKFDVSKNKTEKAGQRFAEIIEDLQIVCLLGHPVSIQNYYK